MKPKHPDREILPVEVFAGTNLQASMLKSMLDDAQIYSFLKDDIMGTLNPWWTDPGGVGAVKVIVANRDLDEARDIVEKFRKNLQEN
ncbi:putative signal transducing protein [Mangrovibacterium lignilyticum]|uniref:putative signal transducing protein n=1 Tax=Mangrovibacterium lignilyticum TaxID=2668052 RepID=UPI0013D509A8|nr:DUF2007 domain-containing protein [Mangrovibacterium lignilyticum]